MKSKNDDPNAISEFAFSLGEIMGALSLSHGAIRQYLKGHGVAEMEIEYAMASLYTIANAVYREPTDETH